MEFDKSPGFDPAVCPICGKPDQCAMAADPSAKSCWCENPEFPQELLDRVPEHALHQTRICRNCLDRLMIESKGAD
ncbi:MAG: cysteine-rich CWC family protein [Anaerolineales bacterium]|jgi:hypothetical protein